MSKMYVVLKKRSSNTRNLLPYCAYLQETLIFASIHLFMICCHNLRKYLHRSRAKFKRRHTHTHTKPFEVNLQFGVLVTICCTIYIYMRLHRCVVCNFSGTLNVGNTNNNDSTQCQTIYWQSQIIV